MSAGYYKKKYMRGLKSLKIVLLRAKLLPQVLPTAQSSVCYLLQTGKSAVKLRIENQVKREV